MKLDSVMTKHLFAQTIVDKNIGARYKNPVKLGRANKGKISNLASYLIAITTV